MLGALETVKTFPIDAPHPAIPPKPPVTYLAIFPCLAVQLRLYIFYCSIYSPKCQFLFERSKKAFHARIFIRASGRAHGSLNAVFSQHTLVCSATVLTSSVAVENKSLLSSAKNQGIGERPLAKLAVDIFAHFIADPPLCFSNPGRQQDKPTPCWWEYRQYLLPRVH